VPRWAGLGWARERGAHGAAAPRARGAGGRHPHQPLGGPQRRTGALGRRRRERDDRAAARRRPGRTARVRQPGRLPGADADEEADIEGLARDGAFLWAVGSHSLRRRQIKARQDGEKALRRLSRVTGQANRQVLVRIPVAEVDGLPTLVPQVVLDGTHGPDLRQLLADDEHLAPFLSIPGKDNGLDVEGIAVSGPRVHLGLRGPVLRGWAVVLELRPVVDPDAPERLLLRPLADGRRYRTHVLRLDGLGVRDLCPHGADLLVLAGPTMLP
jgi:hypothetical protein